MKNYEKGIIGVVLTIILVLALANLIKEEELMISVPIEESTSSGLKDGFIKGCTEEDEEVVGGSPCKNCKIYSETLYCDKCQGEIEGAEDY